MKKLVLELEKHIGKTVTIFTNGGGVSSCGFTGILISVECDFLRLLIIAVSPPIVFKKQNIFRSNLGTIAIIPLNSIASLTYSSI